MLQTPTLSVGFLAISVEKRFCDENFLKPTVCVCLLSPSVEKMCNDESGETFIDTAYRRKFIRKTAESTLSVGFKPSGVEKKTSQKYFKNLHSV